MGKNEETVVNKDGVEVALEQCWFWLDKSDDIWMSVPNDVDGHFISMTNGDTFYPNAYPDHIWARLGWTRLDPVKRDAISDALTELD